MKRTIILLVTFLLLVNFAAAQNTINLHAFYGQGCPHCGGLLDFLDGIKDKYPNLNIQEHEVYFNDEERLLFEQMSASFGTEIGGVPTVFIDDKVIVGFNNAIGESIENEIKRCEKIDCGDPLNKVASNETLLVTGDSSPSEHPEGTLRQLTVPIVISAAAVDAINPCAFAVLIILMTVALSIADKKRALKFGLAFTISIFIAYFLMGVGLFTALQTTGLSRTFYIVVTVLAVIVGLLNVKDYFWYGKGFLMEVP
ncbi:hypothetical protein KY312_01915, partial [Candidatus Woesearchaeota archaeon]|nr:hypothetical protein [Candidatus Woesearchaeota archaeon]